MAKENLLDFGYVGINDSVKTHRFLDNNRGANFRTMTPRTTSLRSLKQLRPSRGFDSPLRRPVCAQCLQETHAPYHSTTSGPSRSTWRLIPSRGAISSQVPRKPSVGLPAVWIAGQRRSLATVRHGMYFLGTGIVLS